MTPCGKAARTEWREPRTTLGSGERLSWSLRSRRRRTPRTPQSRLTQASTTLLVITNFFQISSLPLKVTTFLKGKKSILYFLVLTIKNIPLFIIPPYS